MAPVGPLDQFLVLRMLRQFADEVFDLLRLGLVDDQRCVIGLDDDGIQHSYQAYRCATRFRSGIEYNVSGGVDVHSIGDCGVALGVLFHVSTQSGPCPQVIPFEAAVRNDNILGLLHEGIIDADFRNRWILLL